MQRKHLLSTFALLAGLTCGGSAQAQMAVTVTNFSEVINAINSSSQNIISSIQGSLVSEIHNDTLSILQAMNASTQVTAQANGQLMSAQQTQDMQYRELERNLIANGRHLEPPNSCYTVTAAQAAPAQRQAVSLAASSIGVSQANWGMNGGGNNPAATTNGVSAAANMLVSDHYARIKAVGGTVANGTGKTDESVDPAINANNIFAAKSLNTNEITGQPGGNVGAWSNGTPADPDHPQGPAGWIRDFMIMMNNTLPHKLGDNATAEQKADYITRVARHSMAGAPLSDSIARRAAANTQGAAPGTASLNAWATGLLQSAGMDASKIPANPSWQEVMDILVNYRFSGVDWNMKMKQMSSPEQLTQESLEMQSALLQLEWTRFQYDEKVGAVLGAMYSTQLQGNVH